MLNKNAIWWQTRNNRKLPKHKLSQKVCIRLSFCFALPAWSAGMLFYKVKWKLSLISGYIFSKTIDFWKSKIFFWKIVPQKGFFWQIIRIFDFFGLASDSWYLQSRLLSDLLYSWKFWSWKFIKPRCNGSGWSTFAANGALLPSDVIDFLQCCPLRDFGGKQFYCQMSCDLKVTNESMHCWKEISSHITIFVLSMLQCRLGKFLLI